MTDDGWPYPLHDRPLELGGGHRVQLYNVAAVSAGGPPSFGVQYASALPRADGEGRRREAEAVIRHFAPLFDERKARAASAQVCGTRAQAEMREPRSRSSPSSAPPAARGFARARWSRRRPGQPPDESPELARSCAMTPAPTSRP